MKENIIKCPYCDAEYFPAELFYQDDLLGRPIDIEKSHFGEILYSSGKSPDLTTTYICDYCGKPMKIKALITYEAVQDKPLYEYTTPREEKLILEEN